MWRQRLQAAEAQRDEKPGRWHWRSHRWGRKSESAQSEDVQWYLQCQVCPGRGQQVSRLWDTRPKLFWGEDSMVRFEMKVHSCYISDLWWDEEQEKACRPAHQG